MYVCICNGLTDRDFRRAAESGVATVGAAFQFLGAAPRCGRCIDCVRGIVEEREPVRVDAYAVAAE